MRTQNELTDETLFLGLQTIMLMQYIMTGNKRLKKAIELADLAWEISKDYK